MLPISIISLIIGGAIGFLFSFLTSVVAFGFQLYRDSQTKKWELEKKKQEDAKRVVSDRLENLETEVSGIIEYLTGAFNALDHLFPYNNPNIELLKDFRAKYLLPLIEQRLRLLTKIHYFQDVELNDRFRSLYEIADELGKLYDELTTIYESKDAKSGVIMQEKMKEMQTELMFAFNRFFTRIDVMKVDPLKYFKEVKEEDTRQEILRMVYREKKRTNQSKSKKNLQTQSTKQKEVN